MMEQVLDILKMVLENLPAVFTALGATVAAASAWVLLTPSPRDDEVIGKIRAFIERFSAFFPDEGARARDLLDDEDEG